MIEFIIPLNLPVRAVTVTETTADPPAWVFREMARNTALVEEPHFDESQSADQPVPDSALGPSPSPDLETRTLMETELELLRERRALFDRATDELRHATKMVEKRLDGMLHEFQMAAVEVAHAISAKLVFESVENDRFPVENLVHEMIERLDTNVNTLVQLHPDDLAYIQQFPMIDDSAGGSSVQFIADSTLHRGDCRAKAGDTSVIYELKHQVEEIRRQLLSTVNGHAEA